MNMRLAGTALVVGLGVKFLSFSSPEEPEVLEKWFQDGQFLEAYQGFRERALVGDVTGPQRAQALERALDCLARLRRVEENDGLREEVVARHPADPWTLRAAARRLLADAHFGTVIGGEFQRGQRRNGRHASSFDRDRVRALQLLLQAEANADPGDEKARATLWLEIADATAARPNLYAAWRLSSLTDLSSLPDYDDSETAWRYQSASLAPVDENGDPIFHARPASFAEAKTDGERWRVALENAMQADPSQRAEVIWKRATFLRSQFGVETAAGFLGEPDSDTPRDGTALAVQTLSDDETIARLATGVRRFRLPEEHNHVRLLQAIVDSEGSWGRIAVEQLATIFENRRQLDRAAEMWRRRVAMNDEDDDSTYQARLDQIVGRWIAIEPVGTQPAGAGARFTLRYRNATRVSFEARAIDVESLLEDTIDYLESNPSRLDWSKLNLENLGYRQVTENARRYTGERIAAWDLDLDPHPRHLDRVAEVTTPLQRAGAYLVTARAENGNATRVVLWVADTAIVAKATDEGTAYFVCDADTGTPVGRMNVEFFGYAQEMVEPRKWVVKTAKFAATTDADGVVIPGRTRQRDGFQWLVTARSDAGRIAYLGFSSLWTGSRDDVKPSARALVLTDRPIYRPGQPVHFKVWIAEPRYDKDEPSPFAGREVQVTIQDPRSEKVLEKTFVCDQYGGLHGTFDVARAAILGVYHVSIPELGHGTFRVEEYRKPEFEVKVESPSEPVRLGDRIRAAIEARYYFGSPVTNATVEYRVVRTPIDAQWMPKRRWDWLYGRGYAWSGYDYDWYPGFERFGCRRPFPWWWPSGSRAPEVVAEGEARLDATGRFVLDVDTASAAERFGDEDHRYTITATVRDASRRAVTGHADVFAAREPFDVTVWTRQGYVYAGDVVDVSAHVHAPDGRGVSGRGMLRLYWIDYSDATPRETLIEESPVHPDDDGSADATLSVVRPGPYRVSYTVTDVRGRSVEGATFLSVYDRGAPTREHRYNPLELVAAESEYAPGATAHVRVNVDRAGATVVLFVRAQNGVCPTPQVLRMTEKSREIEIPLTVADAPNIFIEAFTVTGADVVREVRMIAVPPASRILDVEVAPDASEYRPGQEATVRIRLKDESGAPFVGSTMVTVYDAALDALVAGGTPTLKELWSWRRHHHPHEASNLARVEAPITRPNETTMGAIGAFGDVPASPATRGAGSVRSASKGYSGPRDGFDEGTAGAPLATASARGVQSDFEAVGDDAWLADDGAAAEPAPVRRQFADTAFFAAAVETDANGEATVAFPMPENLTAWRIHTYCLGHGARVGEGESRVVTRKDLIVRLITPRFLTERDEVVLSAVVHNERPEPRDVLVALELDGRILAARGDLSTTVPVAAHGEARVDWLADVLAEGGAVIRATARSADDTDGMEITIPAHVHGAPRTDAFSVALSPHDSTVTVTFEVPARRRVEATEVEIRFSPSLAAAIVDALPYLAEYPYGCTEQTMNRFVPSVVARKTLIDLGVDLERIAREHTNLNAQQLGDAKERAERWRQYERNPVFDEATLLDMVRQGLDRLTEMQLADGGFGWFSGYGERSSAHTTATVVNGLLLARECDVPVVASVLDRSVQWLDAYRNEQIRRVENAASKQRPAKPHADDLDALVESVLSRAGTPSSRMRELLYRDRLAISLQAQCLVGLAVAEAGEADRLAMVLRNLRQHLGQDDENQTAWLRRPDTGWWFWYGSEYETNAVYLKLLARVDPKGELAPRVVKFLMNHRPGGTSWKSTRDTALCVEAIAEYLRASGEAAPDQTISIVVDGEVLKRVRVTATNLFDVDNTVRLSGDAVSAGRHVVEIRREGVGPVYANVYARTFSLEDTLTRAGLELRVERRIARLVPEKKTRTAPDAGGRPADLAVESYQRLPLADGGAVESGDLIEVSLLVESKNAYEYVLIEDVKPAGFEALDTSSGYVFSGLSAYRELRDRTVTFFVTELPRGRHELTYRLRAETPGRFAALPSRVFAMYAPELHGNSDELRVRIQE